MGKGSWRGLMVSGVVLSALIGSRAHASLSPDRIARDLRAFRENPEREMWRPLTRTVENGEAAPLLSPRRDRSRASDRGFLPARSRLREAVCRASNHRTRCAQGGERAQAVIWGNDRVEDLIDDGPIYRTLEDMEKSHLLAARVAVNPWASDYWPYFKGTLGVRYGDPAFPFSKDWLVNARYVDSHPVEKILAEGDPKKLAMLSPSEKYDLLVGDEQGTLTAANWGFGEPYYRNNGQVEDWMGICNGWSMASSMTPRPEHGLTLMAADGKTPLWFSPADIKGLASLLWSMGSFPTRFIGGRCEVRSPATDPKGRILSQECFDTNPGTWHMAMTNLLGARHRSVVFDATYDYEVWNQPAVAYAYSYFNPETALPAKTLAEARIPIGRFVHDPFRSYRARDARSIVGIAMDFTYVTETLPTLAVRDSAADDALVTVRYYYDLELDADGEIIGGEWYTNLHPDFIWEAEPGSHAVSAGDSSVEGDWDPRQALPEAWRDAARISSSYSQPLGRIVEKMISAAQDPASRGGEP